MTKNMEDKILGKIAEAIGEVKNEDVKNLKLNDELKDLELDSIDRMELILKLEEDFEIKVPDEAFSEIEKIKDLVQIIENLLAKEKH